MLDEIKNVPSTPDLWLTPVQFPHLDDPISCVVQDPRHICFILMLSAACFSSLVNNPGSHIHSPRTNYWSSSRAMWSIWPFELQTHDSVKLLSFYQRLKNIIENKPKKKEEIIRAWSRQSQPRRHTSEPPAAWPAPPSCVAAPTCMPWCERYRWADSSRPPAPDPSANKRPGAYMLPLASGSHGQSSSVCHCPKTTRQKCQTV